MGNRTLEKNANHERVLHYDELHRVRQVEDVTFGKTIDYTYDLNGNRLAVSEGGVASSYTYDARNQVVSARLGGGSAILLGYDALGRRSSVARPNGVRTDSAYDDAGQLLSLVHQKAGTVLLGFAYTYDAHGMRTAKARENGAVENYGYDGADRLVSVSYSGTSSVTYGLDALGNRLTEKDPTTANLTNATFNAFNQIVTQTRSFAPNPYSRTFAYDLNGNTTSETSRRLARPRSRVSGLRADWPR